MVDVRRFWMPEMAVFGYREALCPPGCGFRAFLFKCIFFSKQSYTKLVKFLKENP